MQILIGNQKQLGWENFLVGRICYDWFLVQKMVTSEVPRKCDTSLHLFWRVLFVYYCQLWRERCFYVTMLQREEESSVLDEEIKNMEKRDWTRLVREDRELLDIVPPKTATTAHKKRWLYNVQCAFEKASFSLDVTQKSLFDFGFATYDPI